MACAPGRLLGRWALRPGAGVRAASCPRSEAGATEIADHEGWLSDSFAIRGRATKLGYTEDVDDLWVHSYVKAYASLGVIVEIGFTGSPYTPREKVTAAVTELTFGVPGGRFRSRTCPRSSWRCPTRTT